jgi:hypothetical protein
MAHQIGQRDFLGSMAFLGEAHYEAAILTGDDAGLRDRVGGR